MELQLDFIPSDALASKSTLEKIELILNRIKRNVIVVLEEGLNPREEVELIEASMREIDVKNFHGIEFYRIDHKNSDIRERIASYISGKKPGITIVGPTRVVEKIKKQPDCISMFAKGGAKPRHISVRSAGKSTKKAQKRY